MTNNSYKDDKFIELIYKVVDKNKPTYVTYKRSSAKGDKIKKYINKEMIHKLKQEIDKHKEKTGGILPLIALLPLIFGGLAATGAVTGGVASAINTSKQTSEQARHHAELEKIAKENKEGGCIGECNCEETSFEIESDEDSLVEKIKEAIILLKSAGFYFV